MGSPEDVGSVLYCSSLLEKKTYEMYFELSQRIKRPLIRTLMMSIAQDSLKHSKLFEETGKEFITIPPSEKSCIKQLGVIWKHINDVTKLLKTKKTISLEDFLEIIKKLSNVEYYMGEEYSILEKVKTLKYMSKEISEIYGIDLESTLISHKRVFYSIISDERRHRETLVEIGELLAKEVGPKDISPKFRYQTPDAWTFPPPNKEIR